MSNRFSFAARRLWSPAWLPAIFTSAAPAAAPPWRRSQAARLKDHRGIFGSRNTFDLISSTEHHQEARRAARQTHSASPASAAPLGWRICSGSNTSASTSSATRCSSKSWANRHSPCSRLENGVVDAAILDGIFSRRSSPKALTSLGEYSELKHQFISQAIGGAAQLLAATQRWSGKSAEGRNRRIAYVLAPKNKPAVIKTLMRRLKTDAAAAEEGYLDLLRGMERKPLPTAESLVHVQRLMKVQNPENRRRQTRRHQRLRA